MEENKLQADYAEKAGQMVLYKYRDINRFTYKMLKNQEIFFSFPQDFNDPFDCFIVSDYSGDKNDWQNFLDRLNVQGPQREKIWTFLEINEFDNEKIKKNLPKTLRDNSNNLFIICCFTEKYNDPLMWAHYSNCHKGICVGFKVDIVKGQNNGQPFENTLLPLDEIVSQNSNLHPDYRSYAPLWKISYDKDYPRPYNGLKDHPTRTMEFIKTKSRDWEYETEWRAIVMYNDVKKQTLKFKHETLSEIFFGLRVDTTEKEIITDIITKDYISKGIDVKLKQAIQSDTEYKIEFEDLN